MSKFRDYSKYEVYEDGRIWSYKKNRFLKPSTLQNGYQIVCLYDNEGKKKSYRLHRVVYEAVTGEQIPNNLQCNHIDENKTNNARSNINLMSPKQNMNWGTRNKRASKSNTNNPKRSKQVGAFKDEKLVMAFPSISECGRQGFDKSNVSKCCNCKLQHYKGYTWKYLNEKRD